MARAVEFIRFTKSRDSPTISYTRAHIFSGLELSMGIICACMPAARMFIVKRVLTLPLFDRWKSRVNSLRGRGRMSNRFSQSGGDYDHAWMSVSEPRQLSLFSSASNLEDLVSSEEHGGRVSDDERELVATSSDYASQSKDGSLQQGHGVMFDEKV